MTSFRAWLCTLKVYTQPASLRMLALGFSAGLPLLLVLGTLSFWLREAGIDRTTIGYLSWVGLAYAFKWVWAPLVDRLPLPGLTRRLGRRRSWLLLSQLLIAAGLLGMASQNPQLALTPMVWSALVVAFGSATQDIALDAYRIESASMQEQAALAATYQTGYRLAMIWAGAGVLWVATLAQGAQLGYAVRAWQVAYSVMAACMVVGIVTVLLSPEPQPRPLPPSRSVQEWLHSALAAPFADFIARYRWQAALVLGLIAVYRISDVVMGIMANPFYVDMQFSKEQVALVSGMFGIFFTLLGTFIGGVLALRLGVMRVLMLGAVLSAASNLLFAWLASHPEMAQSLWQFSILGRSFSIPSTLTAVIAADNLSGGIASAAFIAYLSGLTSISYSATQYALFSSIMLLLPKFIAGFSGKFVDLHGYPSFFIGTALLGIPVVILVWLAGRSLRV